MTDSVRVGILSDPHGGFFETPEEEQVIILRELRAPHYGALTDAQLAWTATDPALLVDAPSLDVLVVDYGALHQNPDAVEYYGHLVRRFADDRPSTVVLLWTEFTSRVYRRVFEAEFIGHPFREATGYRGWCGVEDCGRRASDAVHGEHGVPAANILARYAATGYRGMHSEPVEDVWQHLRIWLGRA